MSSVNDVNCFNPERVITIKGEIPDISRAESEVSTKLRAAYESDLAVMTPHSLMFPGLPPAAMMSTAGISSGPGPSNTAFTGHRGAGGHPQGQSPGVGGAVGGPGAFMPGAGPRPGMSPGGQSQETTYLYIPNTAVGAIIGKHNFSVFRVLIYIFIVSNLRNKRKPHPQHYQVLRLLCEDRLAGGGGGGGWRQCGHSSGRRF